MSKYEFYKRLKRMMANEFDIIQLEANIARKSTKYYETMVTLKTTLGQQEHELTKFHHKIEELQHYNESLDNFIEAEEGRVRAREQNAEKLQKECEQVEQEQIEQRKVLQLKMGLIRKIKEATQTCFNVDALPHRFQGVSMYKTQSTTEWKPFDVCVKRWIQCIEEQLRLTQYHEAGQGDHDMDKENTTIVI